MARFLQFARRAIGRVLWWFIEPIEGLRWQRSCIETELRHAKRLVSQGITKAGGEDLPHRIASLTRRLEELRR